MAQRLVFALAVFSDGVYRVRAAGRAHAEEKSISHDGLRHFLIHLRNKRPWSSHQAADFQGGGVDRLTCPASASFLSRRMMTERAPCGPAEKEGIALRMPDNRPGAEIGRNLPDFIHLRLADFPHRNLPCARGIGQQQRYVGSGG